MEYTQVHRAAQELLDRLAQGEVALGALGGRRGRERDQEVDVAAGRVRAPRDGAEQLEAEYKVAAREPHDGGAPVLEGVRGLVLDAVVGMRRNRRTDDGRRVERVGSGEEVTLRGCSTVARYRVRRRAGWERRYLVATFRASSRLLSRRVGKLISDDLRGFGGAVHPIGPKAHCFR